MSYPGSGEVLKPILLRSATPAPNEKVLNFLQGIENAGEEVHNSPPQSLIDHEEYNSRHSEQLRSPVNPASPRALSPAPKNKPSEGLLTNLAGSPVSYGNGHANPDLAEDSHENDDVDSNTQEGRHSEPDDDTAMPVREPGPEDQPGPHYESYSSWGNKGPLPADDGPAAGHPAWNPGWNQFHHQPEFSPPWEADEALSPTGHAANIALPQSPNPSRVASPMTERAKSAMARSAAGSRLAGSTPSPSRPQAASPENGRSMSPKSVKTSKSHHVAAIDTNNRFSRESPGGLPSPISSKVGSPRVHKTKTAPSIAPSDSPSQFKAQRSRSPAKNVASQYAASNGLRSPPPTSVLSGHGTSKTQQGMSFAPYRNAPTNEDLLHAAIRDRAMVFPQPDYEVVEVLTARAPSVTVPPTPPRERSAKGTSVISHTGRSPVPASPRSKKASVVASHTEKAPSHYSHSRQQSAPQQGSVLSPSIASVEMNAEEERIVNEALAPSRTPRTSYYAGSTLEPEVINSHFHDMELCLLLHQLESTTTHEVVKKVLRKAVRQRVKKLGLRYDSESIRQIQKDHSHHDPASHLPPTDSNSEEPPQWAADIKRELVLVQQRIESLGETVGTKIENLLPIPARTVDAESSEPNDYESRTPTQTVNIHTQREGTMADSMYHAVETDILQDPEVDQNDFYNIAEGTASVAPQSDYGRHRHLQERSREESPGQQFLEEELYKLRQKAGSESGRSHRTWEVTRSNNFDDGEGEDYIDEEVAEELPENEAEEGDDQRRSASPPLPPLPHDAGGSLIPSGQGWEEDQQQPPPWQKIHQRLLSWAMIWPISELDTALNSTTRGHQVDEVALSIWSSQTYKRYVRARLTDRPAGVVDRLFVPPNMADAISNAVFNGRHGVACGMLRSLWAPFGLDGMPRLLIVLAKHRNDENHWVVHRFSLPDGALTTYDSYPERTLPDGRPLGWWFAIRVAWPNAIYPSPDHLMQKMVRLHRPMQLPIDNSVAAAGIWRNLLMGSRAERSLDLERLRDLINTEVKNLRQRKQLGKLSIGGSRPEEEMMFA